jgi:hypothetical protein
MRILAFLCATALWAQAPSTPGSLTVKSATSKQVQLTWASADGAKSYVVERSAETGESIVIAAAAAALTDSAIDPYTTYIYRVRAINDAGQSAASSDVTVGPPPYGFNVVVAGPNEQVQSLLGMGLRMILDANGDPAMAYVLQDPNADGDESDNSLWFVSWNRAQYKWNAPVGLGTIGGCAAGGSTIPISLARDASTGLLGIAFQREYGESESAIELFASTDAGTTWKKQSIARADEIYSEPALALANGNVYLAYAVHSEGIRYLSGKASDDPAKWKLQHAPLPGGYSSAIELHSMAVDSAGNPGIAYLVEGDSDSAEAFWRPESGGSAVVAAANNGNDDCADVSLSFSGTQPRIAFAGARSEDYYSGYDQSIWSIQSTNDGTIWLPPVGVPADGLTSMGGPIASASGTKGQVAIVSSQDGAITGSFAWGFPKISRSDDMVTFQTTAPALVDNPSYESIAYPGVKFGGNDKLWVSFVNLDYWNGQLGPGIVLWRER